jgi:CheY-like chemotaxis protein
MQRSGTAIRILLADDSTDNRFVVQTYLKNSPYVLDIAENGEIAVRKFTSVRHDLILMDIHMPVMDGIAAARKIREWEREQKLEPVPILALTASPMEGRLDEHPAAGFTAHLCKPVRKSTLLETLERVLSERTSQGAPRAI